MTSPPGSPPIVLYQFIEWLLGCVTDITFVVPKTSQHIDEIHSLLTVGLELAGQLYRLELQPQADQPEAEPGKQ